MCSLGVIKYLQDVSYILLAAYYDIGPDVVYKGRREFVIAKSSGPVFIQNDGQMRNHFGAEMDTRAGRKPLTVPEGNAKYLLQMKLQLMQF